jgi:hypothetical protein
MIRDPLSLEHYGGRQRKGWQENGWTLARFFMNRLSRGGPRILLILTLCLILLGTCMIPHALLEILFGRRHIRYFTWPAWTQSSDVSEEGGGLRVVVFGSPDVATSATFSSNDEAGKSWTEILCEQVRLSARLVFYPYRVRMY